MGQAAWVVLKAGLGHAKPASQGWQSMSPAADTKPGPHSVVSPAKGEWLLSHAKPAGHSTHTVAPLSERCP